MSGIHDKQHLYRDHISDFMYSTSHLILPFLIGNIGRLVMATFRNQLPRPAYVLTRAVTELPAKFDQNLSKPLTPMR